MQTEPRTGGSPCGVPLPAVSRRRLSQENEHGSSWAALGTCFGQLSHSTKLHLHPCSVESGMQ